MQGRIACCAVAVALVAGSTAARADDVDSKIGVGGSLTVWFPMDDADDYSDLSLGIRPVFTYWVIPLLGITGTFDYVFVNEEGDGDVDYYAISAGVRLTIPRDMRIKPYGELLIGWHFLDAPFFEESDVGFRFGGGVVYRASRALDLNVGLAYSTASIDDGLIDLTIAAVILDVGIAARF